MILVFGRSDLEATLLRTPGMLYQEQEDGRISNLYNFKIINKTMDTVDVELKLLSHSGEINVIRGAIQINPSTIYEDIFFLKINPDELNNKVNNMEIGVYMDGKLIEEKSITFIGNKEWAGIVWLLH